MVTLSELDLGLIHTLQIAPRISWADAAEVLETSPANVARRWERLSSLGLAWVTARTLAPDQSTLIALIDVNCIPEKHQEVIRLLCADHRVASIEECVGSGDLMLTVIVPNLQELTSFLLDELGHLSGIMNRRSRLVTGIYRRGDDWRLDSLRQSQISKLRTLSTDQRARSGRNLPREPLPVISALERDGRASAADISREVGKEPSSVQRQISGLVHAGRLSFRCDLAQIPSGWPVSCTWYAKIPYSKQHEAGTLISTFPRIRMCLAITGEANLVFTIWARSLSEIPRLERMVEERIPMIHILESTVTLRTHKRMGWLLDSEGRSTSRLVPIITHS